MIKPETGAKSPKGENEVVGVCVKMQTDQRLHTTRLSLATLSLSPCSALPNQLDSFLEKTSGA